jgi:hypothetical protein
LPFLQKLLSNPSLVSDVIINEETDDFKKFNKETIRAISEAQTGQNVTTYKNFDDYLKKMHENVQSENF